MRRLVPALLAVVVLSSPPLRAAEPAGPEEVDLTWMSIANWYFKIGPLRIVMDGYITRVPQNIFLPAPGFPADRFAFTTEPWPVNASDVQKVQSALAADGKLDYVLAGHSHFDHTYDTATWAALSGGQIIGSLSTCYQAEAQNLPRSQCTVVSGSWVGGQGERLELGHGVTVRVVRFNHSGNASNPFQHFGLELRGPPALADGGFRAGVAEDFPNGGGGRAFLFTIDTPARRLSFFVNNSASAFDLNKPVTVDGIGFGSPLDNLSLAMQDAGLAGVDVWIGTGGTAIAQLVVPVLHPKVYIPNHWDGLFNSFWAGMPFPFADRDLAAFLDAQGIQLMPQSQYFDTYRLEPTGVTMKTNHDVKQKLGFSDVQDFPPAAAALVQAVGTTVAPEDCDQ